jgi:heptosyltransferase III
MLAPFARLLLRSLGAIASRRVPKSGAPSDVRSVLVLRIDERVGNVLLTTPIIARLKEALPEASVHMLVARSKVSLIRDLVEPIPFEKRDLFVRPWRFLRTLWRLRRAHYDVAIDASHWHTFSLSSALLLAWSSARIRIAHDRGEARASATDLVPLSPEAEAEPEIRTKLRLLEPLGISPGHPQMSTSAGVTNAEIDAWLERKGLTRALLVGISPGARKADHRMGAEVFAAIGAAAHAFGARPIVLWGPGEEGLAQEIARASNAELAPPTDIDQLAALMRRLCAVVVNDTGPMHLSVAVGTPTIALFSYPNERRWGHAFAPHAVIAGAGRSKEEVIEEARAALERIISGAAERGAR